NLNLSLPPIARERRRVLLEHLSNQLANLPSILFWVILERVAGHTAPDQLFLVLVDYVDRQCADVLDNRVVGVRITPPSPTRSPTRAPTRSPTRSPTRAPTRSPTRSPIPAQVWSESPGWT